MQPGRRHLDGGGAGHALDEVGVPRAGHRQLRREDRGARPERVPVDGVIGCQQRDAQTGLEARSIARDHRLGGGVQDRADHRDRHEVVEVALGVELQHLPDLLGQGHATQQVLDALLDGQPGIQVGNC